MVTVHHSPGFRLVDCVGLGHLISRTRRCVVWYYICRWGTGRPVSACWHFCFALHEHRHLAMKPSFSFPCGICIVSEIISISSTVCMPSLIWRPNLLVSDDLFIQILQSLFSFFYFLSFTGIDMAQFFFFKDFFFFLEKVHNHKYGSVPL